mgnify:CR=1 FL=1
MRPTDLENFDNRIQAFWITVDLIGVCHYDYESGPIELIHAIKKAREEVADPYSFTILADALIREQIYEKILHINQSSSQLQTLSV